MVDEPFRQWRATARAEDTCGGNGMCTAQPRIKAEAGSRVRLQFGRIFRGMVKRSLAP